MHCKGVNNSSVSNPESTTDTGLGITAAELRADSVAPPVSAILLNNLSHLCNKQPKSDQTIH
ncbi:hypothetical protein HanRHA438_Chr10g0435771 [Helianthus annuus]|nr:hypothetical protein HanRHA438_Chr10g0435771 [Helianthus annuus]